MAGRTDKRELDEKQRKRDSDFIWLWICRLVVLVLIFYWLIKESEPTDKWILLIGLLLGVNEIVRFGVKKSSDDESVSITLRKNKSPVKPKDDSRSEFAAVSFDYLRLVALC